MLSYYETLKCTLVSVKSIDAHENFNKMCNIYTKMCNSLADGPASEELREYGASADICLDLESCWNCHNATELRRPVFNQLGSLAYLPVPCTDAANMSSSLDGASSQR